MYEIERQNYIITNVDYSYGPYLQYFYTVFDAKILMREHSDVFSVSINFDGGVNTTIFMTRFNDMLRSLFPNIVLDNRMAGIRYHVYMNYDGLIYINRARLLEDGIIL